MSSCKKPRLSLIQLTPLGKSLFLQHSTNSTFKLKKSTSEIWKPLIISKRFLLSFQRQKFVVLNLDNLNDQKEFEVTFENGDDSKLTTICSFVPIGNLARLNDLLKFPYVKVDFGCHIQRWKIDIAKQFLEEHLTQAKLNLKFNQNLKPFVSVKHGSTIFAPQFISTFHTRIFKLYCNASQILNADCPPLNLDVCCLENNENLNQIKAILTKHKIRELTLENGEFQDLTNDPNYFDDFPLCPGFKKLTTEFNLEYEQLDGCFAFFERLMKFCPNFVELNFRIEHEPTNENEEGSESRHLVDIVFNALKKIREFQKKLDPSVKVHIVFCQEFEFDEETEAVDVSFERLSRNTKVFRNIQTDKDDYEAGTIVYIFHGVWKKKNFDVVFHITWKIDLHSDW